MSHPSAQHLAPPIMVMSWASPLAGARAGAGACFSSKHGSGSRTGAEGGAGSISVAHARACVRVALSL